MIQSSIRQAGAFRLRLAKPFLSMASCLSSLPLYSPTTSKHTPRSDRSCQLSSTPGKVSLTADSSARTQPTRRSSIADFPGGSAAVDEAATDNGSAAIPPICSSYELRALSRSGYLGSATMRRSQADGESGPLRTSIRSAAGFPRTPQGNTRGGPAHLRSADSGGLTPLKTLVGASATNRGGGGASRRGSYLGSVASNWDAMRGSAESVAGSVEGDSCSIALPPLSSLPRMTREGAY